MVSPNKPKTGSGHTFRVVTRKSSLKEHVPCGVPKGPILGPTLFPICVSDINAALENSSTVLYTPDTIFHVHYKCPETLEKIMQEEFSELNEWLLGNKLSIAMGKLN